MPNDWLAAQPRWVAIAMLGALVAVAGIVIALIVAALKERRRARPAPRKPAAPSRPPRQQIEVQAARTDPLEALRRMAAQLEDRAVRLETLIRQADERITALSETATAPPTRSAFAAPAAAPPDPAPRTALRPRAPDPLTQAVYDRADSGLTTVQIARELDEQMGKVELILALRGPR